MLIKKYSNSLSKTIAAATKKGAAACLALCLLSPTAAEATPQNGNIVGGQGVIEQTSPVDMKITQTTARMAIDWNAFDIGANEKVTFLQPGSDSAVLNRVTGGGASLIAGKLNANGSIYFVNPNGINFAAGSAVEAGSMLATTGNVDPLNFMQGLVNIGAGNSIIVNSGAITANNGSVQLIGATEIQNNGTIMSRTVADGGVVILSASNIISNSGKIDASATSKGKGGSVIITSDGVVNLSNGSIYANGGIVSGAGGNLSITAKGNISQSADSGIFLGKGGTGSFDAGTGDVVLNSKNNSFDGTIKITGNNVDLFSKTGYVIGTNKISGNLTLGTETGAVTQNTAILLKTGKTATLNAGKGSISLIEPRNKLSKIIANGGNVAVRSDSTINMGASNVTGQLSLTSDKGDIVQTGSIVAGELVLNAGIGDIALDMNNHVGSLVVLNAGNASYTDTAGFTIGAKGISVNGDLTLKAQGDIIQSETLTSGVIVPGTATFDVGKNGVVKMHGILNGEAIALTRNKISRLMVTSAKQFRLISNAALVIGGVNIFARDEDCNAFKILLMINGDITQDGGIFIDAKDGYGSNTTVLFQTLNENGNIFLKNDGLDNDIKGSVCLYNAGKGSHIVKLRNISNAVMQHIVVSTSGTETIVSLLELDYPNSGLCPILAGTYQPGSTSKFGRISITCGGDLTQKYYDDKGNAYTRTWYVDDAGKTDPQVILKVGGKIDLTGGKYNRFSKIKIIGKGTEYTIKNINNIFLNGITTQDEQVINY